MVEEDLLYAYQGLKDTTKGEESVEDHLPTSITQGASNLHSDEQMEDKIKLLDPRVQKPIRTYLEVFGELPPPASCDKLIQMDLKLKPQFVGHKIRMRRYQAPKEQADEIDRQIQECIDARRVLEYKDGDYPQHCSTCFLVTKRGSTAKRLVVDYGELNKKTLNHSGSFPNMESTLEKIASCRYKTKMDKRSGFWQVDLTPNAQELLAFITPQGRVFKSKVMPFGVANAPALFQELMNKILSILPPPSYLSQLWLTVHHIQGVKNQCADYISRNNFEALIGARSEALAKEAFSRMDVHLEKDVLDLCPRYFDDVLQVL